MKLINQESKVVIAVIVAIMLSVVALDFISTILNEKSNMIRRVKTSRSNAYRIRNIKKKEK